MVFDLSKIDWVALSAIATAFAAWAAARAARAANAANRIAITMEAERRDRRAKAIAGPLFREIEEIERTILPHFSVRGMGLGLKGMWTLTTLCRENIAAPLLERFSDRFDDFDIITSGRLGSLLAAIARMRGPFDPGNPFKLFDMTEPESLERVQRMSDARAEQFDVLARRCHLATISLARYITRDKELDSPNIKQHGLSGMEVEGMLYGKGHPLDEPGPLES